MLLGLLLACGDPAREERIAALEAEVAALQEQNALLQEQVDSANEGSREDRRERLRQQLAERRAERGLPDDTDTEGTALVDGPTTLREALADAESASRMGRALLHRGEDGEFDGYRLSAIRRGSLADRLGLRNGDIVHRVNGLPLASMTQAMEAFNQLSEVETLSLEVTRRGEPITLSIPVDTPPEAGQ